MRQKRTQLRKFIGDKSVFNEISTRLPRYKIGFELPLKPVKMIKSPVKKSVYRPNCDVVDVGHEEPEPKREDPSNVVKYCAGK
jgi:hypothetical protein